MPDFSAHFTNHYFPFISANMCGNNVAGSSQRINAEGEVRPQKRPLSLWEEVERIERMIEGDEEYNPSESDADEMEDAEEEEAAEGMADDETTDGGEGTTSGSNPPKKKKERRPNTVGTVREEITEVSPTGVPLAPDHVVKGYGGKVTAITQTTTSINTENLRHKDNGHLRTLLFEKMHAR